MDGLGEQQTRESPERRDGASLREWPLARRRLRRDVRLDERVVGLLGTDEPGVLTLPWVARFRTLILASNWAMRAIMDSAMG